MEERKMTTDEILGEDMPISKNAVLRLISAAATPENLIQFHALFQNVKLLHTYGEVDEE